MPATLCAVRFGAMIRLERPHGLPVWKNMASFIPTWAADHTSTLCRGGLLPTHPIIAGRQPENREQTKYQVAA